MQTAKIGTGGGIVTAVLRDRHTRCEGLQRFADGFGTAAPTSNKDGSNSNKNNVE